jgi:tetratricopeptide (TPR) repeat protein
MYKKQLVVVVIVFAIMGYLFFQPLKGLIKHKDTQGHTNKTAGQTRPAVNVTVAMVSAAAKIAIGPALSVQVSTTEGQLKNASGGAEKLSLQKKLAKQWDDVNQAGPAAFYYQAIALSENTFADWINAGNHFNDAFRFVRDSVSQPTFVSHAIECFENASKMQPQNLDAKTGLGIAYVNQFSLGIGQEGGPPKGVMLLLDVVGQDPTNRAANLSLGLFAMKSGQYDKAIMRFKTLIAKKPEFEPYFYLAESYSQMGMKKEAIAAYEKSREMMPDTAVDQQIDRYIKELKK